MTKIALIGPKDSESYLAADLYAPEDEKILFHRITDVIKALGKNDVDRVLLPVYNTREGEVKEYFKLIEKLDSTYWIDNIVLPIHLSLGVVDKPLHNPAEVTTIMSKSSIFKQCEEYIQQNFPDATLVSSNNLERNIEQSRKEKDATTVFIENEKFLRGNDLQVAEREVAPHNRTRFAILGKRFAAKTGYDSTAIITKPLNDRVGMLVDILSEFTRRGVNILDLRSENDIKTQKLQIYLEAEGHIDDEQLSAALSGIEKNVIQERGAIKVLGSFPRIDMRVKQIKSFGFVGTGAMSQWFAERLSSEGYQTIMTGRSTKLQPQEMVQNVDVVVICVPISATSRTISELGPQMRDGQAMIILAGESENTLKTALETTVQGVEVMFVHNLWGPQALTMKDKNAAIVRTQRSGSFCSEFEAFLYKHGADIYHDTASKHDLLMGVGQKLPTLISVALAKTLREHHIDCEDISSHSTLTSLYGVLSMVRVHNQNPRTYAEIMATSGDGRKIVNTFIDNISSLMRMAEKGDIDMLCEIMETSKEFMSQAFLESNMRQAKAVDAILSDSAVKDLY